MKIVLLAMFSFIICSCRPDIVTKGNYTMEKCRLLRTKIKNMP